MARLKVHHGTVVLEALEDYGDAKEALTWQGIEANRQKLFTPPGAKEKLATFLSKLVT